MLKNHFCAQIIQDGGARSTPQSRKFGFFYQDLPITNLFKNQNNSTFCTPKAFLFTHLLGSYKSSE